jgi:hypothetical protein
VSDNNKDTSLLHMEKSLNSGKLHRAHTKLVDYTWSITKRDHGAMNVTLEHATRRPHRNKQMILDEYLNPPGIASIIKLITAVIYGFP